MREGLARKYAPWGEFYAELTPMEQFDVCEELLREEYERKGDADPIKIAGLTNDQAVARRLATLASPMWDITHNMCVRNGQGEIGIFRPYRAQEMLLEKYEQCVRDKKPMRVLVPKPRRAGMSEAASKIGGNLVFRNEGFRGLFIGQNKEDSDGIFVKYKVQVTNDPLIKPGVITHMSKSNIELANGSGISSRTAGASVQKKSGIGRGNIFHFFHGSEVSLWPESAIKMMTGILSTMPRWPIWQTAAILESTGNGRDGYFFFKVREALDNPNGVWDIMFLPWTQLHDCFRPFTGPNAERDRKRMEEEILGPNGDPEEKELLKVHGATLEMVNWRRWAISGGLVDGVDEKEKKRNWNQEYPLVIWDCFQSFGADTFSQDQINRQMRKVGPPLRQGDLTSPTALWTRSAKGTVSVTPTPNFKRKADGKVKLWADPVPGRQYVMGVDPSHGLLLGDPSCAVVIDRHEERIVAEWREHCDQEDCLTPVRLLSKLFNDATICVEINLGRLLIKWLKGTDRRKFLFRRKGESGIDQFEQVQDQFGFDINSKTKRQLVGLLREQLQHNPMFFSYEDILGEMLDFRQELNARKDDVIFPGVKEGAGRHDDRVIAASLALVAHVNLPSVVPSFFGGKRPEKLKVSDRWDLNSLGRKGLEQSRELEHPVLGTTKPGKGRGSGKKFINPTLGDSW